jgi:hypothetical protein
MNWLKQVGLCSLVLGVGIVNCGSLTPQVKSRGFDEIQNPMFHSASEYSGRGNLKVEWDKEKRILTVLNTPLQGWNIKVIAPSKGYYSEEFEEIFYVPNMEILCPQNAINQIEDKYKQAKEKYPLADETVSWLDRGIVEFEGIPAYGWSVIAADLNGDNIIDQIVCCAEDGFLNRLNRIYETMNRTSN